MVECGRISTHILMCRTCNKARYSTFKARPSLLNSSVSDPVNIVPDSARGSWSEHVKALHIVRDKKPQA